jgi:parallel beta-helix repeat protein
MEDGMKKNVVLIGVIISLLCLFNRAFAERTIWYVHPDSALDSIQAGLDSCATNDIVLVAPGIYYENIIWPSTQGIHLLSELGPDTTIIDGDSIGNVIALFSGADTTTIISGFTIQNGCSTEGGGILCSYHSSPYIIGNIIMNNITHSSYFGGAGIACIDSSSPIIVCNVIKYNTASFSGGGIVCANYSQAIIDDNTISNNIAWCGGGIFSSSYSSSVITNNTICYNGYDREKTMNSYLYPLPKTINGIYIKRGSSYGGGIWCYYDSSSLIRGNNIFGNSAGSGGGVSFMFCSPIITGNTISDNTANDYGGGIFCMDESSATISGNTITNNTAALGSGIFCWYGSSPNIDSCTISNNYGDGIYCDQATNPVINHNNIINNTGYGIKNVDSSVIIDAEYNWWGDSTGPGGAGPGTGDEVSDYVDYEPWLFAPIGVEEETALRPLPSPLCLLEVYPNPFSKLTKISFGKGHPDRITHSSYGTGSAECIELKIYDASGRLVKNFNLKYEISNFQSEVPWNGVDNAGQKLPCGVYFLEFQAGDYKETRKLLLVR